MLGGLGAIPSISLFSSAHYLDRRTSTSSWAGSPPTKRPPGPVRPGAGEAAIGQVDRGCIEHLAVVPVDEAPGPPRRRCRIGLCEVAQCRLAERGNGARAVVGSEGPWKRAGQLRNTPPLAYSSRPRQVHEDDMGRLVTQDLAESEA